MTSPPPRSTPRERPWALFLTTAAVFAALGALAFGIGAGTRGALSYLVGFAIALSIATAGALLVDAAGRLLPSLAMITALLNYVVTVLVFVLLLGLIGPSAVDVPAFATGLAVSVVPYLAWQFRLARPPVGPPGRGPAPPVSERPRNG